MSESPVQQYIREKNEKIAELESALASERAKRTEAEADLGRVIRARNRYEVALNAAEATIEQIAKLHHTKTGENDRGPYVICDYDKTDWPCKTHTILMQSDLSALARHDAEVKAAVLEEAADKWEGYYFFQEWLRRIASKIRKEVA